MRSLWEARPVWIGHACSTGRSDNRNGCPLKNTGFLSDACCTAPAEAYLICKGLFRRPFFMRPIKIGRPAWLRILSCGTSNHRQSFSYSPTAKHSLTVPPNAEPIFNHQSKSPQTPARCQDTSMALATCWAVLSPANWRASSIAKSTAVPGPGLVMQLPSTTTRWPACVPSGSLSAQDG